MNKFKFLILLITFHASLQSVEKVLYFTHCFNRPDFIELQVRTFQKFAEDDYEFIVMNDSPTHEMSCQIVSKCQELNIKCVNIPQHIHQRKSATEEVVDAIQYSLNNYWFDYDGIVVLVDSDLFLIKPFSVIEYMKGFSLAGHGQVRPYAGEVKVTYLWQGLIFMDMKSLPNKKSMNFDCGIVEGYQTDGGGKLHYYIQENPHLKLKYIDQLTTAALPVNSIQLKENGFSDCEIDFIIKYKAISDPYQMEFYLNNTFLHYRAGGNWVNKPPSYHQEKTNILAEFINKL